MAGEWRVSIHHVDVTWKMKQMYTEVRGVYLEQYVVIAARKWIVRCFFIISKVWIGSTSLCGS